MSSCWKLVPAALLLAACEAQPAKPIPAATVEETTRNADGTRTVARKANGVLEGRTIVYQPGGGIADIFYFHHGQSEGIQRRFYPSGRLATWQQTHQGLPNGDSYGFLPDGGLATVEHYTHGVRTGQNLLFYAQPRNRLHKQVALLVVAGKEWQNGYLEYDPLGRLVAHTGFPLVQAAHDTVKLGDSLRLRLRIRYPEYPAIAAVVGGFDAQFQLRDTASLRFVQGHKQTVALAIAASQRGPQIVRGYIADFQENATRPSGRQAARGKRLYFAFPYFVQ